MDSYRLIASGTLHSFFFQSLARQLEHRGSGFFQSYTTGLGMELQWLSSQSSSTDMSLSAYLRSRTALAPRLHQASCYQLPASKVPVPTYHHGDPFLVVLTQMLLSLVLSFHLSHMSVNTMRRNLPFPDSTVYGKSACFWKNKTNRKKLPGHISLADSPQGSASSWGSLAFTHS